MNPELKRTVSTLLGALCLTAPLALAAHKPPVETVRFIAIGDQGSGSAGQFAVAAAIEQVCKERVCDFALAMGDNIYENGVAGEDDQLFVDVFELPYKNLDFPFYMTLGNHDNSTSVGIGEANFRGDYQIDYYYRQDRSETMKWDGTRPSAKWIMPDRYYTFTQGREPFVTGKRTVFDAEGNETTEATYDFLPLVEFISLDANPIATPSDATYEPNEYARDHGRWLERQLKESEARWQIAFHHQPYISNGEHGNAGAYDNTPNFQENQFPINRDASGQIFKDFYEDYACNNGLDVGFQGHDHDLQILTPPAACPETLFVLSGAGGKTRSVRDANDNEAIFQIYDSYGFMWVEITDQQMKIIPYTVDEASGSFVNQGEFTFPAPAR